MVTTLDMPHTPCRTLPETERTTIGHGGYEGFWAVSGTWEEVVEVDRIAANPINSRDPSGLNGVRSGPPQGTWTVMDDHLSAYATELNPSVVPNAKAGWKYYVFGSYRNVTTYSGGRVVKRQEAIATAWHAAVCPGNTNNPAFGLANWQREAQLEADGFNALAKAKNTECAWEFGIGVLVILDVGIAVVGGAWLAAPYAQAALATLTAAGSNPAVQQKANDALSVVEQNVAEIQRQNDLLRQGLQSYNDLYSNMIQQGNYDLANQVMTSIERTENTLNANQEQVNSLLRAMEIIP